MISEVISGKSSCKLGDFAEIVMGQSPAGDTCNTSGLGFPLLNGPTEFGSKYPYPVQFTINPKRFAKTGDLLFCVRGSTTGKMNWADQDYAIGRGIAAIRGINEYPNSFIRAVIELKLESLLVQATGSTFPNVSRDLINGMIIPCISVDNAKMIASILDPLDHKIALNREMNKTLEAMAQAIFKSWFVDFEPFKEGEFVESELGMIPKGWEVSNIGAETTSVGGATPSTTNPEFWEDGEFYWATPKDLSGLQEKVLIGTERKITNAGVNKISSGQLPVGTVLLSSRAPIGYLAITTIPVSINQGFIAMVCNKRLPNTYVLQWVTYKLDDIKQRGSGTTFAEISKSTFRPIQVLVPDKKSLQKYDEVIRSYYNQIAINIRETLTLSTLRDTLLPKLLSGEIGV